jgi:hypothetical protein
VPYNNRAVEHKVVKARGRVEVYVHAFFTYTTHGGERSALRTQKKTWYPLNTRLVWPRTGRFERSGEKKNQMEVGRSSTPRTRDCRDAALIVSKIAANFQNKLLIRAHVMSSFLFSFGHAVN